MKSPEELATEYATTNKEVYQYHWDSLYSGFMQGYRHAQDDLKKITNLSAPVMIGNDIHMPMSHFTKLFEQVRERDAEIETMKAEIEALKGDLGYFLPHIE